MSCEKQRSFGLSQRAGWSWPLIDVGKTEEGKEGRQPGAWGLDIASVVISVEIPVWELNERFGVQERDRLEIAARWLLV